MSDNPNTVPQPTAAQMRKNWQNKKARNHKLVDIDVDQKYATVLLLLNPAVTQPDDYATLRTALIGVTGIVDVKLLVDGHTVDNVPEGDKLVVVAEVAIRQTEIPIEE